MLGEGRDGSALPRIAVLVGTDIGSTRGAEIGRRGLQFLRHISRSFNTRQKVNASIDNPLFPLATNGLDMRLVWLPKPPMPIRDREVRHANRISDVDVA